MDINTVRIFVGCAANHEDLESQSVLEWSIRKNSSLPVDITWMKLSQDTLSPFYSDPDKKLGWNTEKWATPFSGFRWAIPHICNFHGQAIYLDSDFIFCGDIAELWQQPFEDGKVIMAKGGSSWRMCCSKWNCAPAQKYVLPFDQLKFRADAHATMIKTFMGSKHLQQFKGEWNVLDVTGFDNINDPAIKAIHYTSMPHQPQLKYAIPRLRADGAKHWYDGETKVHWRKDLIELFDQTLEEATSVGYGPTRYATYPKFGVYKKRSFENRAAADKVVHK